MALNAKKVKAVGKGPKQPNIECGTYPARLVQLIDLGVQAQRPYQGKEKSPAHMISTTYEFCDEFMVGDDGQPDESKPRWISEDFPFYSLDQDRAKSTQRYNALDPSGAADGEWPNLVSLPVMLTVGEYVGGDGVTRNKVLSTSSVRAKQAATLPALVNEPKIFLLDDPDMDVFQSLPQWLQDKIKGNLEYAGSALQKALEGNSKTPKNAKQPKQEENEEGDDVW